MAIQVGRTVRVRTVSGGNLYAIAAEEYGDHTLWSVIAQANGLLDPFLIGEHDLVIPDKPKAGAARSGVVGA